jgi:predicted NAD/FAD-binding protein
VAQVTRFDGGVCVTDTDGQSQTFDHVVFACHGDQALAALGDASDAERQTLSAFRYQRNEAVLHKDAGVMPKTRRCWSSWNYRSEGQGEGAAVSVSYWMNKLQGIDPAYPIFVTLNPAKPIADEHVFDRHGFDHPVFDNAAIAAQSRVQQMQGTRNTWFAGAHLRHGFHEDGLWSAVTVAQRLGATIPWMVAQPAPVREAVIAPAGAQRRPAYDSVSF